MLKLMLLCLTVGLIGYRAPVEAITVIPQPSELQKQEGQFTIRPDTIIYVDEATRMIGDPLVQWLKSSLGHELSLVTEDTTQRNRILLKLDAGLNDLGTEGYMLSIAKDKIEISAPTTAGIFYACQTLRQLLPEATAQPVAKKAFTVPCLTIRDKPRFRWRGMHLDVSRHFFPKAFIKRFLDVMALYKFNRFHWHLTDDHGWRIEIKQYPKLTEIGSSRKNDKGGFYTQEDIREIVAYAQERFITIVPEIDMPGHSLAALAAYPELACTKGPFEVATEWGIFDDVLCPCKESTYIFVKNMLSELIALFPGPYIHIGGDECPTTRWETAPICQEMIKTKGLKNVRALQHYFTQRVGEWLQSNGKQFIGWDEILEGKETLPLNAVIMSWRKIETGIEAAQHGFPVIMSPMSHCYFDFKQAAREEELGVRLERGVTPVEKVYAFEPLPSALNTVEQKKRILGAQANIWTELLPTPEHVEYMALPRMAALAEVVWSPKQKRDWNHFYRRLKRHTVRWDHRGLNYRPLTNAESTKRLRSD